VEKFEAGHLAVFRCSCVVYLETYCNFCFAKWGIWCFFYDGTTQIGRTCLVVEVYRSHKIRHTLAPSESSEPVIIPSQSPLSTQHTTYTRDENSYTQLDSKTRSKQSICRRLNASDRKATDIGLTILLVVLMTSLCQSLPSALVTLARNSDG
jgi:hypothetical protein